MRNYTRPVMQSAERTLRAILLLGQRGTVTLTEVAHELDISPSMAHRLLTTCCQLDFARQHVPGGPYEIGAAVREMALGGATAPELRDAGAAQLEKARKELRETVSVVVLEGRMVRFVETLEGDQRVRVAAPIGKTFPAHATAGGRAMLASLPPEELRRRYPTETLPVVTWPTVESWDQLVAELNRIRRRGWAMQAEESDEGVVAVGTPVLDGLGTPRAALVVSVPRTRLATMRDARTIAEALVPHARSIQRRLRGSH